MEIHPEDVEVMMADMNDDYPLLHSLAKKVEEEEGRGELQVSYFIFKYASSRLSYAPLGVHEEFTLSHLSIKVVKHLVFPGVKPTRIPVWPTDLQKLPLV